jgi:HK97 family phage portal protein
MPRQKAPAKKPVRRARSPRRASAPHVIQLRGLSSPTPWGSFDNAAIGPETAIKVTSILAVVRWIAQAVAVMPLQILRTLPDGRKVSADVPAGYVLRKRPNPWQSAYDFYQLVTYWTALHGNGYARVISGDRGWCSELRPMHPTRVRVHRSAADYSVWYEFWNDEGRWEPLDSSEVLHWRWLSDNGLVGLPPAELCGTSIGLARKLDQAATAYWDNSGRPDMVIETDEKIPDEAVAALREAMHQVYGGARNRGKTAVLPKKTRLKTIEQNTMEQSQFQELRDAILADVCRCWGVPSTLLGDHRMARWSNVEQEHLSAQVWGLLPWQRRVEGPVDMALQPVYGENVYCKLDNRGLLRADTASRVALYQGLWQMGAISPNELRDLEDFPLLETPAANETYVQLGFSTLDNAAAAADVPTDAEEPATVEAEAMVDAVPADPAEDPLAAATSGANLAATALNGAQVTALLEVLAKISDGSLDKDAAVALITSAFPTIAEDFARQMVDGANEATPQDPPQGGQ